LSPAGIQALKNQSNDHAAKGWGKLKIDAYFGEVLYPKE